MKRILLVAATEFEIEPTLRFLEKWHSYKKNTYILEHIQVTTCITKAGMVNTAFELGQFKGDDIDLAINAGVAGTFDVFKIGEVVNVMKDCFSELGAENDTAFLSIDEIGLGQQKREIKNLFLSKSTDALARASGITVNTVHGNEESIQKIVERYHPDVESMEGAAFIHAANAFNWKAIQLRSISNRVEKRNRDYWNLPLAIQNLNKVLLDLLNELNH
ncbi:MAG: futalosine hydrolase [Bacteroidia bacterium]|nr:futalosine hydrolase [Bacteroidia bacterium]